MHALAGLMLLLFLSLPVTRYALESSMVGHMLWQMPLLVVCGALLATALPQSVRSHLDAYNGKGIPGMLLVTCVGAFWMLPRSLDAALEQSWTELAKFITLPLLAGLPLYLSWGRLPAIGRGVVWSKLLAMLVVLSWLYQTAPQRVCNNYLESQQETLGLALAAVAGAVAVWLGIRPFWFPRGSECVGDAQETES